MLPIARQVRLGDSLLSSCGLQTPGFALQLVRNRGCDFDSSGFAEAGFGAVGAGASATLTVALEGTYESWGQGGHAVAGPGSLLFEVRQDWRERWSGDVTLLMVQWDEAPPGWALHKGVERVGAAGQRAWRTLAEALPRAGEAAARERVLRAALQAARSCGVVLPEPDLVPPPPEVLALRSALNRLLCSLHTSPQLVDLESCLGVSQRQIRRLFAQHAAWLRGSSFRDKLSLARLTAAVPLLAAPDTRGAEVARALGYGSDRALYTALRNAGLR